MAITLEQFCTKTGKSILVNGEPVAEQRSCLAEYLDPGATYRVGVPYLGITTPEDLTKHEGLTLDIADHDRFYFRKRDEQDGQEQKTLREKVFDEDDPSLGAAYGSLLFTPLVADVKEFSNIRVLVVDWKTGENATVADPATGEKRDRIPRDIALQLVGEGDGRIDDSLHWWLGNPPNTQFQIRGAIKQQENYPVNQVIKGTMAPLDLKKVLAQYFPDGEAPDLIISTDQLKGRKNKDNPLGLIDPLTKKPRRVGNEMKPGEYTLTVGIGKRQHAKLHQSSTGAQMLNAVGEAALPDVQDRQVERLREINEMLGDPRKTALDYIKQYEKRQRYADIKELGDDFVADIDDFSSEELKDLNNFLEKLTDDVEIDDDKYVRLLKADLAGHFQIMEMPRIVDKLREHCQEQLRDCALGRFLKFESSMALSCRVLKENEVCIPHLTDGEEVIVYRPPVSNSNVMGVLTNRHIEGDALNPMRRDSIMLHPDTAARLKIDMDGDEPIFALASEYPDIAAEIVRRNQPGNAYRETVTPPKAKYAGMSFEQIALAAMNNSTGLVANHTMKAIALESECRITPDSEKENFLRELSKSLVANREALSSVPEECKVLKDNRLQTLASLQSKFNSKNYNDKPLTPEECASYMELAQSTFKDVVGILANQLEIEVQAGKSANRSNPDVLKFCNAVCDLPVHWLNDRKRDEVYVNKPIRSNRHGIVDSLVQATNDVFTETSLSPRRVSQFRELFKGVDYTDEQKEKAGELRDEYNGMGRELSAIKNEIAAVGNKPYLKLVATTTAGSGRQLEIALTQDDLKHPQVFLLQQLTDVMLIRDEHNRKWKVTAAVIDEATGKVKMKEGGKAPLRKQIGYLTDKSERENRELIRKVAAAQGKDTFLELRPLNIEIFPGYTKKHEEAVVSMLGKKAEELYNSIPDREKQAVAAAMWALSTRQSADPKKSQEENIRMELNNKSSAVFAIFDKQIEQRLDTLQFTDFQVVGTQKDSNEWRGRHWQGEKVDVSVELLLNPETGKPQRWIVADGKRLGVSASECPQLPAGTTAEATITSPPSTQLMLASAQGNSILIGHVSKYDYKDKIEELQGQKMDITIKTQPQRNDPTKVTGFAWVDGKKLGQIEIKSFDKLRDALETAGVQLDGFKLPMTVGYAPANHAIVTVDPATVKYPLDWTRDNLEAWQLEQVTSEIIRQLHPALAEKYSTPSLLPKFDKATEITLGSQVFDFFSDYSQNIKDIVPDYAPPDFSSTYLSEDYVPPEELFLFEELRDNLDKTLQKLTEEITDRFGARCFLQRAETVAITEYYFCVDLTGVKHPEKIEAALPCPYKDDVISNGERQTYIAIPLRELQELAATHYKPAERRGVPATLEEPAPGGDNLLEGVTPLPGTEKHFSKDWAMGARATQFIGIEANPDAHRSSTRNYREAAEKKGVANTGRYCSDDIIMVSGSLPSAVPNRQVSQADIQRT